MLMSNARPEFHISETVENCLIVPIVHFNLVGGGRGCAPGGGDAMVRGRGSGEALAGIRRLLADRVTRRR